MKYVVLSALTALATIAVSAPSQAALTLSSVPCAASNIDPFSTLSSVSCVGFFNGNLSSSSTSADQTAALALLGLTFPNAFANSLEKIDAAPKVSSTFLNFDTLLYGETFIEVHWGNIPNPLGGKPLANNITAFYKFDAGTTGLDKIFLNFQTASNAIVYKTGTPPPPPPAVPEPATWALMLGGFAIVGSAMRRRSTAVSFG
jgi:hypothetical protein